jgi:hypothetical protein
MDTELEKYTNVVYQKIGRNVVLFQQIERILKYLAATSRVSGYADKMPDLMDGLYWQQQPNILNRMHQGKLLC